MRGWSSDQVVALFTAIGVCLTAVGTIVGYFQSFMNGRNAHREAARMAKKIDAVQVTADQTHEAANSKMDQLLKLTAKASLAEGKLAGPDAIFPTAPVPDVKPDKNSNG
jgi:hypothetical protein